MLCKKATIDFSSGDIATEHLLVRKNFISNINLGKTSYLNFNNFGIDNNVLDCLSHIKLWVYWSRPRFNFYASSTTTQQPVMISNRF